MTRATCLAFHQVFRLPRRPLTGLAGLHADAGRLRGKTIIIPA